MVYLICFEKKFKHAKHYIGWAKNAETFEKRMKAHEGGYGSCLLKAVVQAGIKFKVTRIWNNADGNFERKLKKRKESKRLCPCCNKNAYNYAKNGEINESKTN